MIKTNKKTASENLKESIERWNFISQNGTEDKLWAEGATMNIVRKFIIQYREEVAGQISHGIIPYQELPDVPPEMDENYIVNFEEKKAKMKKFFEEVKRLPVFEEYTKLKFLFDNYKTKANYLPYPFQALSKIEVMEDVPTTRNDVMIFRQFSAENPMQEFLSLYDKFKKEIDQQMAQLSALKEKAKEIKEDVVSEENSFTPFSKMEFNEILHIKSEQLTLF